MTSDGTTSAQIDPDEAARPPTGDGRRGFGWIELWWQPVGELPDGAEAGSEERRRSPELHVTDHRAAQFLTLALAVLVAAGTVWWAFAAASTFEVPPLVCAGCAPPDWFRWLHLAVAVVGIAAAVVQIAYFISFAVRGVVWRRWNTVTIALGALAAAWTAMQWIDRLWL